MPCAIINMPRRLVNPVRNNLPIRISSVTVNGDATAFPPKLEFDK